MPSLAEQSDTFLLYELSVQCPEAEVDFIDQWFRQIRSREARSLREDFCSSAAVCYEWTNRRASNTAIGVDHDPNILAWSHHHRLSRLEPQIANRIKLLEADVRLAVTPLVDIINAMNFSYWCFFSRAEMLNYFSVVNSALVEDGIFFLDAFGGYDAFRAMSEVREIDDGGKGFTYIWEQESYNPITGAQVCHIHFAFPDGSRIDRAFSYRWRLWTLPEIMELLEEAGFQHVTPYWQGWDENDEPDGIFRPAETADADAGWICYLSAEK